MLLGFAPPGAVLDGMWPGASLQGERSAVGRVEKGGGAGGAFREVAGGGVPLEQLAGADGDAAEHEAFDDRLLEGVVGTGRRATVAGGDPLAEVRGVGAAGAAAELRAIEGVRAARRWARLGRGEESLPSGVSRRGDSPMKPVMSLP